MQDEARKDELDVEEPSSRSQFLKIAGGTGAAGALALFIAACGGDDEKSSSSSSSSSDKEKMGSGSAKGDLKIVNYALTLEYLEADFYKQVIESGEIKDKKLGEVAKTIANDENEHVAALTATVEQLGGKPAAKPTTNFDDVLAGGEKKILETAATVENLGAAAYLGQAANIKSKEVLAAALSIHTVEGRHAAVLNSVIGKSIVPDGAFAKPADMATVLKAVKPFIKA
ncbi:MAG TPA: ferritin-like domain-containing protein [Thermoleophilaceae bacterium]|nr:ferritin-like domain-containing protein [Thermoleophilaceae bacterium]